MSFTKLFSLFAVLFTFVSIFSNVSTQAQDGTGNVLFQIQPTDAFYFCLQSDTGELQSFSFNENLNLPAGNYTISTYSMNEVEAITQETCQNLIINNAPTLAIQEFTVFAGKQSTLTFAPESQVFLTMLNLSEYVGAGNCTPTQVQAAMENTINCTFSLVNGSNFTIDPLNRPYLSAFPNDVSSTNLGYCEIDGENLLCNFLTCYLNDDCITAADYDVYLGFNGDISGHNLVPTGLTFSIAPSPTALVPVQTGTTTAITTTPAPSSKPVTTPKSSLTTIRTGGQDVTTKTNNVSGSNFLWVGLATLISLISARFTNMSFKNWN